MIIRASSTSTLQEPRAKPSMLLPNELIVLVTVSSILPILVALLHYLPKCISKTGFSLDDWWAFLGETIMNEVF